MGAMRILLKTYVTRGEIEYLALDLEWQPYTTHDRTEENAPYKVWLDGDGENQSVIIYTEDEFAELRYMSVNGVHAQAVVDQIRASVDVYTREELQECIAGADQHDQWIRALRRLGASLSPTFEQWAFEALCAGLDHPDARVRLAAIAAIGFPAWREFVEPLSRVQETDPDLRVLRRAARLLSLLQEAKQANPTDRPL
jgi:HEAT repeat protein